METRIDILKFLFEQDINVMYNEYKNQTGLSLGSKFSIVAL